MSKEMRRAKIIGMSDTGYPDLKVKLLESNTEIYIDPFVSCVFFVPDGLNVEDYRDYVHKKYVGKLIEIDINCSCVSNALVPNETEIRILK